MKKIEFKPGNMVYPVPAALVSVGNKVGETNMLTIAWTGTICSDPPMAYISVRPERYSHEMICESEEFVINLTTEKLAKETDYCGVVSGRNEDKWEKTGLTKGEATNLTYAPIVMECPVSIECVVTDKKELGSHTMFIGEVVGVQVSEEYMDENGKFSLGDAGLIAYSHGSYMPLGKSIGSFGYSVRKKKNNKKKKNKK